MTRNNPPQSSFADHEWSLLACRLLLTRLVMQCRIECVMNLVEGRRSGVHNVADFGQCIFLRHEGSMPDLVSYHAGTATLSL
jgi:hypothetical protein